MNWKPNFDTEDRAVSPVIGVILMVAVTVILAAVVSMLVLGMGSDVETHPQASFSFDYDSTNNDVIITHEGGDTLDNSSVSVVVDGAQQGATWNDDSISGGDFTTVGATSGQTVKVIWQGSNGDTAVLGTYEVP